MSGVETQAVKLNLKPGIDRNTTDYDAEGAYVDCDKIRFRYGRPEKIGGWVIEQTSPSTGFTGVSRDIITWVDLENNKYLSVGTSDKVQIFRGGVIYDVTPIMSSASTSSCLNTVSGSPILTVSVNAHNQQAGNYVLFTTTTASVAGVNLASEYQIVEAGPNYFTVSMVSNANATLTSTGGGIKFDFLYFTGLQSNGAAGGWGAGTWGTPGVSATASAGWGRPRGGTPVGTELRQYSLDTWGEDLLFNPRGGPIFIWESSAGLATRGRPVSSAAPSIVNIALVAQPARHLVAFGTHNVSGVFDPLLIRWSDSEDYNKWVAAATNQAGSFRLESGSIIQAAVKSRREIVVFTDEDLHSMRRIGGNFVFSFENLGKIPGIVSQHAGIDVNGIVYWMTVSGFYLYNGAIEVLPCSLSEFVFQQDTEGSLNLEQKEKVFAGLNTDFNEIIWLYPAGSSTECSRYIIYNYLENIWYDGTLDRTVWVDNEIFEKPYAVHVNGKLYTHEVGKNDDAGSLKAFIETSDFEIGNGERVMFVDKLVPDGDFKGTTNMTFTTRKYPGSEETVTKGPFAITSATQKIHPRVRGRHGSLRYSTSGTNSDFRLGANRLFIKPDGAR